MPVQDIKASLRGRNGDFENNGYRYLPITKPEYIIGLLGPDGKINTNLIPAWLWAGRQQVGIADLVDAAQGGYDIDTLFKNINAFNMSTPPTPTSGAQGSYVEVTTAGQLKNVSVSSALYELIGEGNQGVKTFPLELQTGDYIVLVKVNATNPKYSFAIVDNTYGDASTVAKGIVQLYAGIDSASNVLAATAGAVKTAYDLAYGKEPAITKLTAFNRDFTASGGNNGSAVTVARGDHKHGTFARASSVLAGGIVFSDIVITDGLVTAIATRAMAPGDIGAPVLDDNLELTTNTWSGHKLAQAFGTISQDASNAMTEARKGLRYYGSLALADAGGHANGDIVMVLEN